MTKITNSELLAQQFLEKMKTFQEDVELVKVLKSRTYRIGKANVLVRAASEGNRRYFFGINYLTVEEIANLENPYVAFICGAADKVLIIPAKLLFNNLSQISHDRNGEYKINIDRELNIVLSGRSKRLNCKTYINNWNLLFTENLQMEEVKNSVEESLHSILQGRLIEIGNMRGYHTYCPDKSRVFNDKKLEEIAQLKTCPKLEFSDHNLLRQIDVIWFRNRGNNYIPEFAFEVELSTGVWSGVGRLSTLIDYSNVSLYVIANDGKKFKQVISTFSELKNRYRFVNSESLGELYAAERNVKKLQADVGL